MKSKDKIIKLANLYSCNKSILELEETMNETEIEEARILAHKKEKEKGYIIA